MPAGRELVLSLVTTVSSETSAADEPVAATLARPLVVDGRTVVPAGSRLSGEVTGVRRAGRRRGHAQVGLKFTRLDVRGRAYDLDVAQILPQATGREVRLPAGSVLRTTLRAPLVVALR